MDRLAGRAAAKGHLIGPFEVTSTGRNRLIRAECEKCGSWFRALVAGTVEEVCGSALNEGCRGRNGSKRSAVRRRSS